MRCIDKPESCKLRRRHLARLDGEKRERSVDGKVTRHRDVAAVEAYVRGVRQLYHVVVVEFERAARRAVSKDESVEPKRLRLIVARRCRRAVCHDERPSERLDGLWNCQRALRNGGDGM